MVTPYYKQQVRQLKTNLTLEELIWTILQTNLQKPMKRRAKYQNHKTRNILSLIMLRAKIHMAFREVFPPANPYLESMHCTQVVKYINSIPNIVTGDNSGKGFAHWVYSSMPSLLCWQGIIIPDTRSIPKKIVAQELVCQKYLYDSHNQVCCFTSKESCSIGIVLVVKVLLIRDDSECANYQ